MSDTVSTPAQAAEAGTPDVTRRARVDRENAHVTGELPVLPSGGEYVGRHRADKRTRPEHRAANLVRRWTR